MAAIQLVLSLFRSGDELILEEDIYGGTYRLLKQYEDDYGILSTYANFSNSESIEKQITSKTKALFIETPTNPLMRSEEHTSELQSRGHLVCRLLLEKKKYNINMKRYDSK